MPEAYVHMSSMRRLADEMAKGQFRPVESKRINPSWSGANVAELGRILLENPNFAALGSIGPDLFYFVADFRDQRGVEISSLLKGLLEVYEDLYDGLDGFISSYEKYLGPINEDTEEELSRLTGGLSETVGAIVSDFSSMLITAIETVFVEHIDFLGWWPVSYNLGYDEQAFTWADMFHYRKTSSFAKALWHQAQMLEDNKARAQASAYALGFMTHVGTDTVGHSFVNTIAGGPYRNHWTRHHLVENHLDASWYLADAYAPKKGGRYPQITESALYYDIAFSGEGYAAVPRPQYPTGRTLRDLYYRRRMLDADPNMPEFICDVIRGAVEDTYYGANGKHPKILREKDGRLTNFDISEAYNLQFRYFKYATVDGFAHDPPDPPDIFGNLSFPTLSDPGDPSGGAGGGDESAAQRVLDCVLAIIRDIAYVAEVAAWVATLPWAALADVITYPIRLGLYYSLELPMFHMLKFFRIVMVMMGYFLPMDDEIVPALVHTGQTISGSTALLAAEVSDVMGGVIDGMRPATGTPLPDILYPRLPTEGEYQHPWDYPLGLSKQGKHNEACPTAAGPFAADAGPEVLFAHLGIDPDVLDRLEEAIGPHPTDVAAKMVTPDRNLGDAVTFAGYMIWRATRSPDQEGEPPAALVDWNLDSDRGYGYHCWDWNRNNSTDADPEGNRFPVPCTWPPGASDNRYNAKPLLLHYPRTRDPGCFTENDERYPRCPETPAEGHGELRSVEPGKDKARAKPSAHGQKPQKRGGEVK